MTQGSAPLQNSRGWTLVEVLVVAGIIGTLVALIWTLAAPARDRALEARCLANLQRLGQAIAMYRQDYGGLGHPRGRYAYWQLGLPLTPFSLESYLGYPGRPQPVPDLLRCPADRTLPPNACSYGWWVWDGVFERRWDFADVVSRRWGELPIVECGHHNPGGFFGPTPAGGRKELFLRLGGTTGSRRVRGEPFPQW